MNKHKKNDTIFPQISQYFIGPINIVHPYVGPLRTSLWTYTCGVKVYHVTLCRLNS